MGGLYSKRFGPKSAWADCTAKGLSPSQHGRTVQQKVWDQLSMGGLYSKMFRPKSAWADCTAKCFGPSQHGRTVQQNVSAQVSMGGLHSKKFGPKSALADCTAKSLRPSRTAQTDMGRNLSQMPQAPFSQGTAQMKLFVDAPAVSPVISAISAPNTLP